MTVTAQAEGCDMQWRDGKRTAVSWLGAILLSVLLATPAAVAQQNVTPIPEADVAASDTTCTSSEVCADTFDADALFDALDDTVSEIQTVLYTVMGSLIAIAAIFASLRIARKLLLGMS